VITAGCTVTCTGAYHFTAASLIWVRNSEWTWQRRTNASIQHSGHLQFPAM